MPVLSRRHVQFGLASALVAGALPCRVRAAGKPGLKIGIVVPLTGPSARYGGFAVHGAELAVKQINAAGGVNGAPIVLARGDSQGTPVESVSATRRMLADGGYQAIIGDVASSATIALQPVMEDAKVVLLNAASSNPDITYKAGVGGFKWTFRSYPTDELRAKVVLQYGAQKRGFTRYAGLCVDSDYGRGAIAFSKKYLPELNCQLVSEDYFKDDETDFRPVLSRIRSENVQAILSYGIPDASRLIGRQMMETGLAGKVFLMGSGDFTYPDTVKAAPRAMEGAVEVQAWAPDLPDPRSQQFVADYKASYPNETPNVHSYTHWEAVHLLAAAATAASGPTNDDLRAAVAAIDYEGATGRIRFDRHNQAELPMFVYQVVNGKGTEEGSFTAKVQYPGE